MSEWEKLSGGGVAVATPEQHLSRKEKLAAWLEQTAEYAVYSEVTIEPVEQPEDNFDEFMATIHEREERAHASFGKSLLPPGLGGRREK